MIDLRPHLRAGDTILVGHGTAEPRALLEALIEQRHELPPVTLFVGASYTGTLQPEHLDVLRVSSFGAIGRTAALIGAGADVLPVHLGTIPALIRSGRLRSTSCSARSVPRDGDGIHSLGLLCDYLPAAIEVARCVIAEVNPRVPRTSGDTAVPASRLAATVHDDRPLIAVDRRAPLPEDEAIAAHVAGVIPDGATIQIGVGGTPEAVLARLTDRRDLGIHSGPDQRCARRPDRGRCGDQRAQGDRHRRVRSPDHCSAPTGSTPGRTATRSLVMRSLDHTHALGNLLALRSLHAINSAIEVDLTGQISAEVAAGRYVGAIGGQGGVRPRRGRWRRRGGRSSPCRPRRATARSRASSPGSAAGDDDGARRRRPRRHRARRRRPARRIGDPTPRRLLAIAAPHLRDELERST